MWSVEQTREAARRRLARDAKRDREVTRIIGFGSAFDDRLPFTFSSDIDLAVLGGTIVGWKIAEQSPWKVDFVQLEDQDQSMVDAILASGVVLYERR